MASIRNKVGLRGPGTEKLPLNPNKSTLAQFVRTHKSHVKWPHLSVVWRPAFYSACFSWQRLPNQPSISPQVAITNLLTTVFRSWLSYLGNGDHCRITHIRLTALFFSVNHWSRLAFLVTLTQPRVIWEEKPRLGNCLLQIGLWACLWRTVLITDRERSTLGGWSWAVYKC